MRVSNAEAFAADVEVQLALEKSIAIKAKCHHSWVTVSITVAAQRRLKETLRRLQVTSAVSIDYSIKIPTEDGSDSPAAKAEAEALASNMIEGLSEIGEDTAAFKSVVESELQLASVGYEVSEVTASSTSLTRTWEDPLTVSACSSQSLVFGIGFAMFPLVW